MAAKAKTANPGMVYQEGRRAFASGRYGQAIRAWKPIAGLPAMQPVLAEAYLRRGLEQGSETDLEQALELAPGDDRPLRALLGLRVQRQDLKGIQRLLARGGGRELMEIARACTGTPPADGRRKLLALIAELSSGGPLPEPRRWPADIRPMAEAAAALLDGRRPPAGASGIWEPCAEIEVILRAAALLEAGEMPPVSLVQKIPANPPSPLAPMRRAVARRLAAAHALRGEAQAAAAILQGFPDACRSEESAALQVRIGALHYGARRYSEAAAALRAARGAFDVEQAMALALEGAGDSEGAVQAWLRVLRAEERRHGEGGRAALAKVHLHIARLAWRTEDFRTAARHFEAGLAGGDPDDPEVLAEYAECLDELARADEALEIHLRYLRRVPGDTRTLTDLVDSRMVAKAHDDVLRVIEALPELPSEGARDLLQSALALIALESIFMADDPARLQRTHRQILRMPEATALAQRTGAIVLAREGRVAEADALLARASPPGGDQIMLRWTRMIGGAALLRVGRFAEAQAMFAEVGGRERTLIAAAHCLMHSERTGAASCAGSDEGREMERLLREVAEDYPSALFADPPRRARRCAHFSATLGHLRASLDPERVLGPLRSDRDERDLDIDKLIESLSRRFLDEDDWED